MDDRVEALVQRYAEEWDRGWEPVSFYIRAAVHAALELAAEAAYSAGLGGGEYRDAIRALIKETDR